MDLNIGEFVRTKNGYIGKIENINDFRPPENKYAIDIQMGDLVGDLVFIGENFIAKNSEDIIDLIEVGDYVNGCIVTNIIDIKYIQDNTYIPDKTYIPEESQKSIRCICVNEDINSVILPIKFYKKDIKTIVTKELFEKVKYIVGEENE